MMCVVMHEIRVFRLGVRRCPAESHRRRVGSRVFHRRVGAYSSVGSFSRGGRQISPHQNPPLDESPRGSGCHAGSHPRRHSTCRSRSGDACYSRSDFSRIAIERKIAFAAYESSVRFCATTDAIPPSSFPPRGMI